MLSSSIIKKIFNKMDFLIQTSCNMKSNCCGVITPLKYVSVFQFHWCLCLVLRTFRQQDWFFFSLLSQFFFPWNRMLLQICPSQHIRVAFQRTPPAKGQLISECLFYNLKFSKKLSRVKKPIWQISALECKKWSNHKI